MLHGRDPYGAEVTREIQRGYWGREIDRNSSDPAGAARFWYPLYVVFLLAPTVTLSFESVRILYVAVGAGVSIASVWLWLRFLGHSRPRLLGIVSSILLVGSLPAVYALHLQQLTLIVAAAIAASLASISAGLFWPAGIMLAVATIKPQNSAAIIGWLLLWSCSDWNKRKTLFISFGITMAAIVLGSELLAPGWITEWRDSVSAYSTYTDRAPAHVFIIFKSYLGVVVSVALIICAGLFCWIGRRDSPATDRFRITAALVLAVSLYLNPALSQIQQSGPVFPFAQTAG